MYRREWRWEAKEIGQGHYYNDLGKCMDEAEFASERCPDHTIIVDMFRPLRFTLVVLKGGIEIQGGEGG